MENIDWNNPKCAMGSHFNVHDAIYLPTWGRLAVEADGLDDIIKSNLIKLFIAMNVVRDHFGKPIRVHVSYRPMEYNKAIGGSLHSAHSEGLACDFDVIGMTCDDVRKDILDNGLLDTWNMRMEDAPGSNWVHLDLRELVAGKHRFFNP